MKLKKAPKKKPVKKPSSASRAPKKTGKNELEADTVFEVRNTVLFRKEINLRVSVLNLENQTAYQATGIAACLWLMLDGKTSNEKLVKALKDGLKLSSTSLEARAKEFFNDIFLKNLVQIVPTSASKSEGTRRVSLPFSSAELKKLRTTAKIKLEPVVLAQREVAAGSGTALGSSFYTTSSSCGN